MSVYTGSINFTTKGEIEVRNITDEINKVIRDSGLKTGIACVFVPGATGAITTIEYEEGLISDIKNTFNRLIPKELEYKHELRWHDGNGHSHIRASLLGPSISVPFLDNHLKLGVWQQIIFIEFDNKSHERNLVVQLVGD